MSVENLFTTSLSNGDDVPCVELENSDWYYFYHIWEPSEVLNIIKVVLDDVGLDNDIDENDIDIEYLCGHVTDRDLGGTWIKIDDGDQYDSFPITRARVW